MENYNIVNTAFNIPLDIGSLVISIMMSIYFFKGRHTAKESRYFLWVCILNSIFILADLSGWIFKQFARSWYPVVFSIGRFVYYSITALLFFMLLKYVVEYVSSFGRVSKVYMCIAWVLAGFHWIGSLITPFTGFYYEITEENMYRFGNGILFYNILPVVVLGMITMIAFRFRKILPFHAIIALFGVVEICVLGQMVKVWLEGVFSANPPITLAIVLMFFNIQFEKDIQMKKEKEKLEELNTKIMLSQIQPHFLYNTLAVIRSLCGTDPETAKDLINDFSVFLRANMDSLTNEKLIPFEQELFQVKSYLNLEQQMYGEKLHIEYEIPVTQFLVPTLSLQPIVENAVQKGIGRKTQKGGRVIIRTEEAESYFQIMVADDGVGFDRDILKEKGHIGIKNVRKRLNALCGGRLIIDTAIGKGTTVLIRIPKEKGETI